MATQNAWNSKAFPTPVASGGTGQSTLTAHSLLVGEGTSGITQLGVASNGQLPIGSAGSDPVLATLTAGTGITITNGAGTITIASSVSTPASFSAYIQTGPTAVTGDGTYYGVICNTSLYNVGSGYSTSTGLFTAPSTGHYIFGATVFYSGTIAANSSQGTIRLVRSSGSAASISYFNPFNTAGLNGFGITSGTAGLPMSSGDTIQVQISIAGNATKNIAMVGFTDNSSQISTAFWGYQVS